MKPRIQANWVEVKEWWHAKPYVTQLGWEVFWAEPNGRMHRSHFWLHPAAVDFALERVLDFRKINHLHLWP